MNFKFKLRKGKSKATIISELRYGTNIRVRIATPYSLLITSAKYWHPKNQLLKIPNDILEADQINNYLNITRTKIYAEFTQINSNSIADKNQITEKLRQIILESKPKYKFISCHSARRSFCTNAYNSDVPLRDIMTFSGHSSEKMVLLYIKASAKEKAKRASDHVYFS